MLYITYILIQKLGNESQNLMCIYAPKAPVKVFQSKTLANMDPHPPEAGTTAETSSFSSPHSTTTPPRTDFHSLLQLTDRNQSFCPVPNWITSAVAEISSSGFRLPAKMLRAGFLRTTSNSLHGNRASTTWSLHMPRHMATLIGSSQRRLTPSVCLSPIFAAIHTYTFQRIKHI